MAIPLWRTTALNVFWREVGDRGLAGAGRGTPRAGALELPVRSQQLQGPFGQGHLAVFAPFASSDPDQHPLRVDVRDLQLRPFRQAQSTGLDHPQTHPGFRVGDHGQQGADLLRTPHERQFLALAGANERQDRPRSLERHLVEEFDPVEMDAERALCDLLLVAAGRGRTGGAPLR